MEFLWYLRGQVKEKTVTKPFSLLQLKKAFEFWFELIWLSLSFLKILSFSPQFSVSIFFLNIVKRKNRWILLHQIFVYSLDPTVYLDTCQTFIPMVNPCNLQELLLIPVGELTLLHTVRHWHAGHDQAHPSSFHQSLALWSTAGHCELLLAAVNCCPFLYVRQGMEQRAGIWSGPVPPLNKNRNK